MTKIELMDYCWSRDFNYEELLRVVERTTSTEIPSVEDYRTYGHKAFEDMLRFTDQQYEDTRSPGQKARQEMGMIVEDCSR